MQSMSTRLCRNVRGRHFAVIRHLRLQAEASSHIESIIRIACRHTKRRPAFARSSNKSFIPRNFDAYRLIHFHAAWRQCAENWNRSFPMSGSRACLRNPYVQIALSPLQPPLIWQKISEGRR